MHTNIAVIESNWWRKSNVSVRGLFDLVANINFSNPNAYHYEMANSEAALKEAIERIATYRECRFLCLAMHGGEDGLCTLNDDRLSRAELRNCLLRIKDMSGSKIRGLHLGSCLFTSDSLARFLYAKPIDVSWIAGYNTEVDWIESSALDLLFFNTRLQNEGDSELQNIEAVARRLMEIASGLVEQLGFGIYVRKRGGGIKNLLEQ